MSGAYFHSRTATNVAISQDGRVVINYIYQFTTICSQNQLFERPFNVLGVIDFFFYYI